MQLTLNNKTLDQEAVELLQQYEPPEGYHLAFSGGKDSVTIYKLAQLAKVKFFPVYNQTGIDPPELVYFIRQYYPDVIWQKPEMTMWQAIQKKQLFPTRTHRFCCQILKEKQTYLSDYVITGVRASESLARRKRKQIELSKNKLQHERKIITFVHPILYWKDSDVWDFISGYELEVCCLYKEGFKRIGCILCPFTNKSMAMMQKERYPKFYNLWLRAAYKLKVNGHIKDFATPEIFMDWWMSKNRHDDSNCSFSMFDGA